MPRSIHRKIIAAVASTAILITAFGVGAAQADSTNGERLLGAIIGLAVLGAIVNELDDDKDSVRQAPGPYRYNDYNRYPQPYTYNQRYNDTHRLHPQAVPPLVHHDYRQRRRAALPAHCLTRFEMRGHVVRGFSDHCLRRSYRHVQRLPAQCERRVRTPRGPARIWLARCLRQNGYQIARR